MKTLIPLLPILVSVPWLLPQLAVAADVRDEHGGTKQTAVTPTELPPEILASVRHPERRLFSRGVRAEERDAYYRILKHARDVDYADQKREARRFLSARRAVLSDPRLRDVSNAEFPIFVQLYSNARQRDVWYGQLVTLRGRVRRLISYPAGQNPYGLDTLYEAWLYTDDSQGHPVVIVCSTIPEDIPRGAEVLIDFVSVTGYLFKMYAYEAQDEPLYAPLILAQRLEWRGPRSSSAPRIPTSVAYGGTAVGGLTIVFIAWWITRRDRRFRKSKLYPGSQAPSLDIEGFPGSQPLDTDTDMLAEIPPAEPNIEGTASQDRDCGPRPSSSHEASGPNENTPPDSSLPESTGGQSE